MPKISIRTSVLTIVLALVGVVAVSLLVSQYYFSEKIAIESTTKTFKLIAKNITEHLRNQSTHTRNILQAKRQHSDIFEPITFNPKHPSLEGLIQALQIKKNVYAIYFAHENGDFYEVVNMHDNLQLFQTYDAPKQTTWTVITIINNQQQLAFLDRKLNLIEKKITAKEYDPRVRPWYIKAVKSKGVISTNPYLFSNLNQTGITYATEFDNQNGVLALDYTMEQLNEILALQKIDGESEIFLVNHNGKKLASSDFVKVKLSNISDISVAHKKWFKNNNDISMARTKILDPEILEVVLNNKTAYVAAYSKEGNNYFAMVIQLVDQNSYLGIKIDADALFKPYRENIEYSFFIAFSLLLLSLPIVFLGTSFIIKPIKALILENEKIKHRKFHQVKNIETYISEFGDLSDSFVSMSHSIQAYEKDQEKLLDSIIKLIAEAIDAKSHYTGGHCERVPEIAQLLLDEANRSNEGVFKNFSFTSKEELKEFEIGAWLHDCGKVTTPEYVVDKSTKLETIYNRIHEIRMRFEVLWRDAEIAYLKREISLDNLHEKQEDLRNDFEFIAGTNIGGEFMDKEKQERIKKIAIQEWQRNFDDRLGLGEVERLRYEEMATDTLPVLEKLLSDKVHHIVKRENFNQQACDEEGFKVTVPEHLYNYGEIYNLCIAKGTLSPEERYKINEHVIMSIKMLEKIPFPEHLRNIPEYAGTHHETLIGTGYPRKLTKEELSIPARIMAIADIFEALTASDRPYKKAKTLTDSIKIMSFMAKDQHIDTDLFNLFLKSGVFQKYAQQYLKPEQIDSVDIDNYLV